MPSARPMWKAALSLLAHSPPCYIHPQKRTTKLPPVYLLPGWLALPSTAIFPQAEDSPEQPGCTKHLGVAELSGPALDAPRDCRLALSQHYPTLYPQKSGERWPGTGREVTQAASSSHVTLVRGGQVGPVEACCSSKGSKSSTCDP